MAPISVTLAPRDPPAAVVALVGEHDAYSAGRLEAELAVLLDAGRRVVVDLGEAEFIDSVTLGVLMVARGDAERASLGFTLVLPDGDYAHVNQLLELTGLRSTFAIYQTLEDALEAARSGATQGGDSVRSAA